MTNKHDQIETALEDFNEGYRGTCHNDGTGLEFELDQETVDIIREALEFMRDSDLGQRYTIDHDGFTGTVIGSYTTKEGKEGVVLQQDGTRVVHVYGRKWLKPTETQEG